MGQNKILKIIHDHTQKKMDDRRNGERSSKRENKNQIIGYLNPTISIISFYVNGIDKVNLYMLLTRIILQVTERLNKYAIQNEKTGETETRCVV